MIDNVTNFVKWLVSTLMTKIHFCWHQQKSRINATILLLLSKGLFFFQVNKFSGTEDTIIAYIFPCKFTITDPQQKCPTKILGSPYLSSLKAILILVKVTLKDQKYTTTDVWRKMVLSAKYAWSNVNSNQFTTVLVYPQSFLFKMLSIFDLNIYYTISGLSIILIAGKKNQKSKKKLSATISTKMIWKI